MKDLRTPNGSKRRLMLYKRLPWSQQPPECDELKIQLYSRQDTASIEFYMYQTMDGVTCAYRQVKESSSLNISLPYMEFREIEHLSYGYSEPMSLRMFSQAAPTMADRLMAEWRAHDWEKCVREEWEQRLTRQVTKATVAA